ncbi:hypothetical protein MLGJGCBP_04761 [Rhodococcus sp. T7]|nr:hypothetical protein MLGJGCBP_09221 [Rhodococcus sp. T7]KAF0962140.1 hypothetical protein MLGJGCBP_04761 [Rhodococcus sp. T7]
MAIEKNHDPLDRLTPNLRELLAPRCDERPPVVGLISPVEVDKLVAIITRSRAFDEPVNPHRAIQVLASSVPPELSVPILDRIVGEPSASIAERVNAANELGRLATPEAERVLTSLINDRDPRIQQVALVGLGMCAGPSVLGQFDNMEEPHHAAVRRQLTLARALIAYRDGLDGPFLPEVKGAQRQSGKDDHMITPTLRMKSAAETTKDRAALSGSRYGIEFSDQSYELTCGRAEWTVFVNRELGRSITALDHFFERPWVAAILSRWFGPRVANSPQYLVFTRPFGDSARIDVVRTDGEPVYTGTAEQIGPAFSFAMTDVDRPGTAPTNVAGKITSKGANLEVSVSSAKRVGVRSAEPVIVP